MARRGAWLAAAIYLPIAAVAAALAADPVTTLPTSYWAPLATIAVLSGVAGVALLGAGLTPAALGSRIDAVVVGIAMAIGAPVAATASLVIWGWVIDSWMGESADLAAPFLRAAVLAAVQVAPLVALGAAAWVMILRRISPPLPEPPPDQPPGSTGP